MKLCKISIALILALAVYQIGEVDCGKLTNSIHYSENEIIETYNLTVDSSDFIKFAIKCGEITNYFIQKLFDLVDTSRGQAIIEYASNYFDFPYLPKITRILFRLVKVETVPQVLELFEQELSFRFDQILSKFHDPFVKKFLTEQFGNLVHCFFKKQLMVDSPFVKKFASNLVKDEFLEPLDSVWNAYDLSVTNQKCAEYVFCQSNLNYKGDNFFKRYIVMGGSFNMAYYTANETGLDYFELQDAIVYGADGKDCKKGLPDFCVGIMDNVEENEVK